MGRLKSKRNARLDSSTVTQALASGKSTKSAGLALRASRLKAPPEGGGFHPSQTGTLRHTDPTSSPSLVPLKRFARIAVVFLLLGSMSEAVEPGLPSKTAVYAAAARAIGSKNPNLQQRNPDYLAIRFLGPRERAILPDYPMDALDLDFDAAMKQLGVNLPVMSHAFRTKAFDATLI